MSASDVEAARAVAAVQAELDPGERLVRAGCPRGSSLAMENALGLIFMVVWTSLAGAAFLGVLGPSNQALTIVPGLFLLIGLAILANLLLTMLVAWRTSYAVNDRRLIEVRDGLRRRVTSWTARQITSVARRYRPGGRGNVIFHQTLRPGPENATLVSAAFIDIPDARAVEALIRQLAAS